MKTFRIICLKRSIFADRNAFEYTSDWYKASRIVYWAPHAMGYVTNRSEAGHYTPDELTEIGGRFMDWLVEPTWV